MVINDKELSQPGVESTGSRWQLEVEQTAYGIELLCQGQWLDRNLQELCWHLEEFHITHQHTRWRGQDILTQSTPTAVVQDHYGFSLLWLCSMKRTYDRGLSFAFAILKYLTEHRAQPHVAQATNGLRRLCVGHCDEWDEPSFLFPSHFQGRPSIQIRTNTRSSEYKHSTKHISTRTPTHKPMHT